jgi:phenylpyruvate tautomerase PptA (4-oxalocrotonate tautomerase family)
VPTYVCNARTGLLTDDQKQAMVAEITRLHSEATGAPATFVQVVIDEGSHRRRYLGGEATEDHIWIRADIREGRTKEQREKLMFGLRKAVSKIANVGETDIWIYICNLEPDDMMEYGNILPQPGKEQEWMDALPEKLRERLKKPGFR